MSRPHGLVGLPQKGLTRPNGSQEQTDRGKVLGLGLRRGEQWVQANVTNGGTLPTENCARVMIWALLWKDVLVFFLVLCKLLRWPPRNRVYPLVVLGCLLLRRSFLLARSNYWQSTELKWTVVTWDHHATSFIWSSLGFLERTFATFNKFDNSKVRRVWKGWIIHQSWLRTLQNHHQVPESLGRTSGKTVIWLVGTTISLVTIYAGNGLLG